MFRKVLFALVFVLACAVTSAYADSVGKVSDSDFKQLVLDQKGVVVVDFFASWCQPCQMQSPIIEKLASQMPNVKFYKLDTDQAPQTITKNFRIESIPTIIIFKDGRQMYRGEGLQDEDALRIRIQSVKP